MFNQNFLLQIHLQFEQFRSPLLCFVSAFIITLLTIPPLISLINRYKFYDIPDARKEHTLPVPTMGGIAIAAGFVVSLLLWFPFYFQTGEIAFFFSIAVLFALGIMDDLRDLSAKYKFIIQLALASLIAVSGIRITSFEGMFGIYDLPVFSQYLFTVLAITAVTNAFNLIDGIDGLAGGLAFMSLLTLGLFLTICGDVTTALIAFALAGGVFAFLYFNFNPARIFMGDTGSLLLGFVISVLCVRLLQVNVANARPVLPHASVFVFGLVLIPIFDTIRVFAIRIWNGKSPFSADRIHIHHLLTNQGYSHAFAARVICFAHAMILIMSYLMRFWHPELMLVFMFAFMLLVYFILGNMRLVLGPLKAVMKQFVN